MLPNLLHGFPGLLCLIAFISNLGTTRSTILAPAARRLLLFMPHCESGLAHIFLLTLPIVFQTIPNFVLILCRR